jgi:outer membrane protein OmpA-like peptidoglycan-associated protein
VGYARLFQTDAQNIPDDAQFLLAGVQLSWLDRRPAARPPVAVAATPATAPAPAAPRCPMTLDPARPDADGDGCPDPDHDVDAVPDTTDRCPEQPEAVNGLEDGDGCPDAGPVRVEHGRLALDEQVHFFSGSARVRPESRPVLEAVARLLGAHPEYGQLAIEGHADDVGSDSYNYRLSFRRASAVAAILVEAGADPGRMRAFGYGRRVPVQTGSSSRVRAFNRRVEFVIDGHRSVGTALTGQGWSRVDGTGPEPATGSLP